MIFFLTGGYGFESLAQDRVQRWGYNFKENQTTRWARRFLRLEHYPWHVCFLDSELTPTEKQWTRQAMQRWNNGYYRYRMKRWGTVDVLNIPQGPLFKESCEYDHGIVYIEKNHLPGKDRGRYGHRGGGLFSAFQGLVEMDKRKWTKELFINVMMHELGHILGLPHAYPWDSDIMISHGFGCETVETEKICDLLDADFESFLKPYRGSDKVHELKIKPVKKE